MSTGPWWATSAARTHIPQYFCESAFPCCPRLSLTIFLSLPGIAYTIVFNICLPRSFIAIARDTARAYAKKSLPPRTTAIRNIATLCHNMTSISRTFLGASQRSHSRHLQMPGKVPKSVFSETLMCQQTLQTLKRNKDSRWQMMRSLLSVHCCVGRFNGADDNNLGYCICCSAFSGG